MSKKKTGERPGTKSAIGVFIAVFAIAAATTLAAVIPGLLRRNDVPGKTGKNAPLQDLMYEEAVTEYSEMYSVPVYTIYAVIKCESGFNENAVSRSGAVGLMQLMPSTFEWLCGFTGEDPERERLFDPETNIRYGVMMLSRLYRQYGDWKCVHAAYNAGQGNVNKWLADERYSSDGKLFDVPFGETKAYLEKIEYYKERYKRLYKEKGWKDYDD